MAEFLDSRLLEYRQSTSPEVWIDITEYLVSDVAGEYGLPGEGATDRLADTGTCDFSLNNVSKIFTPGLSGSAQGFGKGTKVRYTCFYGGEPWRKFYGSIDNVTIDTKDYGPRLAVVSCVDWMNNANTFPLKGMVQQTNKTMADGVYSIIGLMPTPPLAVEYRAGGDVFPTIFDSVSPKSKAASEFSKLVLSELGYIYLRRSKGGGERLIVESRATRDTSVLSQLPLMMDFSGSLLLEGGIGDFLLMNGGHLKLHQTTSYAFDNDMQDVQVVNGEYITNDVTVRVYPRKVDSGSMAVLFTLNKPIDIASGETITIRGSYTDATTKKPVNFYHPAPDVATNVSYTLTGGAITISPAVFGSDSFILTIVNAGAATTISTLTVSGYAIHIDEPIESDIKDEDSIAKYDYRSVVLDQAYQDQLADGLTLAYAAVYRGARPRSVAKRISEIANTSINSMAAFLSMDIGSLISVVESDHEVNSSYYISRIGWTISVSGVISYWFEIQEALSFSSVFWQVGPAAPSMRSIVGHLVVGT